MLGAMLHAPLRLTQLYCAMRKRADSASCRWNSSVSINDGFA